MRLHINDKGTHHKWRATRRLETALTALTMIFTIRRSLAVLLLFACSLISYDMLRNEDAMIIAERVSRLGLTGNDDMQDLKFLAQTPAKSIGVLIDSIVIVRNPEIAAKEDSPETEHALWMIRALRYLTGGKDFCAPSTHVFGDSYEEQNRKYWLTRTHGEFLTFFGYWMSRARVYVAPVDAQEAMKDDWKKWFEGEGRQLQFTPLSDPQLWDWYW